MHDAQGNHEEALSKYEEALAMKRRVLLADHPSIATSLHNIGSVHKAQGKHEEALAE